MTKVKTKFIGKSTGKLWVIRFKQFDGSFAYEEIGSSDGLLSRCFVDDFAQKQLIKNRFFQQVDRLINLD